MPDDSKKLQLDDEHIAEISKKISQDEKGSLSKKEAIFAQIIKENESSQQIKTVDINAATSTPKEIPKVVIKSLRTFQGDASEVIKTQNTSVLSIALAEKKKQQEEVKISPPDDTPPKKKMALIFISSLLIILGVGSVAAIFYLQKNAPSVAPVSERENTIVGFKTRESLDVTKTSRDKLLEILIAKRQEINLRGGEIAYLALTKKDGNSDILISPQDFFALLRTKAPGSVLRSFGNEIMFGFYHTDTNEPFILIKLSSFENAFDGMLKWESDMNSDIGAIFTRKVLPIMETKKIEATLGTSTASTTPEIKITKVLNLDAPVSKGFVDEAVSNKDARVLLNTSGNTILLYSFVDKDTLLITTSRTVMKEMVGKLVSQKLVR